VNRRNFAFFGFFASFLLLPESIAFSEAVEFWQRFFARKARQTGVSKGVDFSPRMSVQLFMNREFSNGSAARRG
jgi:hypothetical protein